MVLNEETAQGDTWANRTATQLLSARHKRNGRKKDAARHVVFRATESDKASNAKPLNCTGVRVQPTVQRRERRRQEAGGEGGKRRMVNSLLVHALK